MLYISRGYSKYITLFGGESGDAEIGLKLGKYKINKINVICLDVLNMSLKSVFNDVNSLHCAIFAWCSLYGKEQ